MRKSKINISGFKIGTAENRDGLTGVTVILAPDGGATAGVDVRGCAPGTRETDLLDPRKTVQKIHAVVLSGGSAFGLEAASGCVKYLAEQGVGFPIGNVCVPIVCSAVLFDLMIGDEKAYPDLLMGYEAAKSASSEFLSGCNGAGTGATVGKLLGFENAMKSGAEMEEIMAKRKSKPIVAVVGRPNVGKSTLFNALAGENISIVKDTPGITRDRIYADIHWLDMTFTLIDTGGIEPDSKDVILSQMREQAEIAMETADVIIFLVDVKQGLVDADSKVADMLRRSHKPVVLVVNKVDSFQKYMADVYEFYNLGIGDPHPISAVNRLGIGDMLEAVTEYFDKEQAEEEEDDRTRVAIVGKPNVGKSSLINKLLGENRLIVSDIAGTTRDAVDTEITYNGKEYVFIDTAGLRRKNKIKEELERYMIVRTVSAVERAEVVVLMIDAEEGVTEQDAKIAGIAHERGKATIIVVNKWDAIEKDDKTIYKFTEKVRNTLSFMPYAELLFVSAKTGQRLPKLFETIDIVSENHAMRVATGVLNEIMAEAVAMQQPPSDKGKRLRLYYITQVAVKPPTFVIFVNDKELMHFSYTRYIENQIRETFGFKGTPLRFIIRERKEKDQ